MEPSRHRDCSSLLARSWGEITYSTLGHSVPDGAAEVVPAATRSRRRGRRGGSWVGGLAAAAAAAAARRGPEDAAHGPKKVLVGPQGLQAARVAHWSSRSWGAGAGGSSRSAVPADGSRCEVWANLGSACTL